MEDMSAAQSTVNKAGKSENFKNNDKNRVKKSFKVVKNDVIKARNVEKEKKEKRIKILREIKHSLGQLSNSICA